MLQKLKTFGGWLLSFVLTVWTATKFLLDWIGRSTLPEDWKLLMTDKMPAWGSWLFSTPWWVPAILATAITVWVMWVSRPRPVVSTPHPNRDQEPKKPVATATASDPIREIVTYGEKGIHVGKMIVASHRPAARLGANGDF